MRLLLLAAVAVCLIAQEQPTFKARVPLVVVPVSVSKKSGEQVWDLKSEDFELLDNGEPRDIKVEPWGTYQFRISLVVVVQTSGLSKAALLKVKKIASMLDGITGEGGEVAVIAADSRVETLLDFSKAWEEIQEAFETLHAGGGNEGHILDGVDLAINLLAARPGDPKRLILLLSETRDRGSKTKAADVLTRAQKDNLTIYTATYSAYLTPFSTKAAELQPAGDAGLNIFALFTEIAQAAKQNVAKTLASYTGGRQLGFETLRHLEDDLSEIGKEVHSQYQLSFVPPSEQKPVYHQLTASIKGHHDLVVRARPGYWNGIN